MLTCDYSEHGSIYKFGPIDSQMRHTYLHLSFVESYRAGGLKNALNAALPPFWSPTLSGTRA